LLASAGASAQIEVENPWIRATPPGARMAAGYAVLRNAGTTPDRLVSGQAPGRADRVETHVTQRDGEGLPMGEVPGYEIPAGGRFELEPGGAHLMFIDIARPFREGETVPVTLRFEKAGDVKVEFRVTRTGPSHGHGHGHGHGH